MSEEELEQAIKDGRAKQIHLYIANNMLRPRGTMEKESLGLYILDKLNAYYESWTNPKYSDNPSKQEVIEILNNNLMTEVRNAWDEFIEGIKE